jgi:hypothetical protein
MDDQWFYGQDGAQRGPVDFAALQAMARSGQLRSQDLVWRQGMTDWLPASQVLAELFAPAPAPVPPSAEPVAPTASAAPIPQFGPVPPANQAPPVAQPLGYQTPLYDPNPQNGRAVTSLVLGILSLPMCACPIIGIGFGIAAVVLGLGVNPGPNKGLAIGGIVCGGLGILLGLPQSFSLFYHLF